MSPRQLRLLELLENFLGGISAELVVRLAENLPACETISPFQGRLQISDVEILTGFFEHGPRRNHNLNRQAGLAGGFIPQETLDDLLASAEKVPPPLPNPLHKPIVAQTFLSAVSPTFLSAERRHLCAR